MIEARAQLLEITARLLIREVDESALKALLAPKFAEAMEGYEPGTRAYLEGVARDTESGLEKMAVDFCALFLANSATAPYASAWNAAKLSPIATNRSQNATTEQILQAVGGWMREVGMEIAPGEWGNVPRDHVAVLVGLIAHALWMGPRGLELAAEIKQQVWQEFVGNARSISV